MRVRLIKFILLMLLVILVSFNVHAFGLSFEYMENNTLRLYPGQNYLFKLTLPNNEEVDEWINISLDTSIATLVGEYRLKLPAKTYDKYVLFNITVPKAAQPGDTYNVNYMVSPTSSGEGQVPIAVRYDRNFRVLVVEKPKEPVEQENIAPPPKESATLKWALILVASIVLMGILILLWRKSHQASGKIMRRRLNREAAPRYHRQPEVEISHEPIREAKVSKVKEEEMLPKEEKKPALKKEAKVISSHHYFHLRNGRALKNLDELCAALESMSQEEFSHYVSEENNHFANWVEDVLEENELASAIRKKNTKQGALEAVKNELNKH